MFDLSISKLAVLAVHRADRLRPGPAAEDGRSGRAGPCATSAGWPRAPSPTCRSICGPEFTASFDLNDLNPRHFVRKHLLDDSGTQRARAYGHRQHGTTVAGTAPTATPSALTPGESPPYDAEAT